MKSNRIGRRSPDVTFAEVLGLEPRLVLAQFEAAPADLFFRPVTVPVASVEGGVVEGFGYAVTGVGDITGDGREDYAVSAPGLRPDPYAPFSGTGIGYVFIYDAASNAVVRTLEDGFIGFGAAIARVRDIDGDGVRDLAVGSPQWRGADDDSDAMRGRVAVYSGADGSMIRSWEGEGGHFRLGAALSQGDADDDGDFELVAGAPGGGDDLDEVGPGRVLVFSLDNGETLTTLTGENPGDLFGHAVFAGGDIGQPSDINGDGVADIVVGAPGFGDDEGRVYVYEGPTGDLRYTVGEQQADPGDRFGSAVFVGAESVVLVGAPGADPGGRDEAGEVFSLRPWDVDGTLLAFGDIEGRRVGTSIAEFTDISGDSRREFAVVYQRVGDSPAFTRIYEGTGLRDLADIQGTTNLGAAGATGFLVQEDGTLHALPAAAAVPRVTGLMSSQGTYRVGGNMLNGVVPPSGYMTYRGIAVALSELPGLDDHSVHAVNELGDLIVSENGVESTIGEYFLYRNGVLTPLADAFEAGSRPTGRLAFLLSNAGHIVVNELDAGIVHLIERGVATELFSGTAIGVNAAGLVAGNTLHDQAVLRTSEGEIVHLNGYRVPQGRPVNGAGQVILVEDDNEDLFIWQGGDTARFSTVTRSFGASEVALSDNGEAYVHQVRQAGGGGITPPSSQFFTYLISSTGELLEEGGGVVQRFILRADGSLLTFDKLYFREGSRSPQLGFDTTLSSTIASGRLDVVGMLGDAGLGSFDFPSNLSGADLDTIFIGISHSRSAVAFTDVTTGAAHVVANVGGRLIWFAPQGGAYDAGRELPLGAGHAIVGDIATFTSADGRVHIVGIDASGDLILVYQLNAGAAPTDLANWASANVTQDHFQPQGIAMPPVVSGLAAFSTRWGGMNVVWLDDAGAVRTAWWAPGITLWREDNLSQRADAPALHGNLAPYLTAWDGINIAGLDENGAAIALWWVPQFADQWEATTYGNVPELVPGSLTAYVTPWSGLNVAGVTPDGETVVLWWTPTTPDWIVEDLQVSGADPIVKPRLTSVVDPATGAMNVVGISLEDSRLVRMLWTPEQSQWTAETV